MTYEEAGYKAGVLRDAIVAIERAEQMPELIRGERNQLHAAKTALEYALLRIAINLLEQQADAGEGPE